MPILSPENETAWQVVRVCASQLRVVGMGTALGFDFDAILTAMDIVGVNLVERRTVFELVRHAGEAYAALLNRRAEEDRRAADPKAAKTTKVKVQPPPLLKNAEGVQVRDRAEAGAARAAAGDLPSAMLSASALSREDSELLGIAVSSPPSGVSVVRADENVRLCPISTPPAAPLPRRAARARRSPNSG
jgi:hypothetical protein